MDACSLGRKILALRREKGWTQKELAARLHVTDKAVSKWETGINVPDVSLWQPMADLFHISLPAFLGYAGALQKALTRCACRLRRRKKREKKMARTR